MKLCLVFLLGIVGASLTFDWQQAAGYRASNPSFPWPDDVSDEDPREVQMWHGHDAPNIAPLRQYHHNENVNQFYYPVSPSLMAKREPFFVPVSSRQKNRPRPYSRPVADNDLMANGRFFASLPNIFFPSALFSYLNSISSSAYSTTTTYLVLNSTLTTTLMTSCIPVLSFSASSLANVACRRRRHLVNEAFVAGDQLDTQDPHYRPADESHERWTESLLVDEFGRQVKPDILSSMETDLSSNSLPVYVRKARSARYTITSTFTSYSFYTVNATKTAFLGSSLFCMPSGFKTC